MRRGIVCAGLALGLVSCGSDSAPAPGPLDSAGERRAGDGGPPDGGADGVAPADGAADSRASACLEHWDCAQGNFCYHGECIRDGRQEVYHCGKPGCPPGQWCIGQDGKRSTCAESATYPCANACDCGPAHCCKKLPGAASGRCVKDRRDPFRPGGNEVGVECRWGEDPTYCCENPACHAGRLAYGNAVSVFRCYRAATSSVQTSCGGAPCLGSALSCVAGEQCVETLERAPPGATCQSLAGGRCISAALAEAVFDYGPSDVIPGCAAGCQPGSLCDAGSRRAGGQWTYQRVVARCGPCDDGEHHGCGSCGNALCESWEGPAQCPADCRCGDDVCSAEESEPRLEGFCAVDCGPAPAGSPCNDDGTCDPWEAADACSDCRCGDGICAAGEACPSECAERCSDAPNLPAGEHRHCGDGVCQATDTCRGAETCRSCPQDCGACRWRGLRAPELYVDDLNAVWGSADNDVIVVGEDGAILRWDGSRVTPMASGSTQELHGVWGSSPSDVIAVGAGGTALRFDGHAWSATQTGLPTTLRLRAVWGASSKAVFAVGADGTILFFDGISWTPMDSGTKQELNGVWGSSASDVYAVGDGGTLLRYDGKAWAAVDAQTTQRLNAVWGSGEDDVYVVGAQTIRHFDGKSWSSGPTTTAWLTSVGGRGAKEVYVGGLGKTLLRFDGSSWATLAPGADVHVMGIWASPGGGVYLAGSSGQLVHHDGQSWHARGPGTPVTIRAAWVDPTGAPWLARSDGTVLSHDGKHWRSFSTGVTEGLSALWGSAPDNIFVATLGKILRFDGKDWSFSLDIDKSIRGLWGSSASDVFAVGDKGTIVRFDGQAWAPMSSGTDAILAAVWGSSPSNVFAAGHQGAIVRYDGKSWLPLRGGTNEVIRGLWGSSASDVYAVGYASDRALVLHFDGTSWLPMDLSPWGRLLAVWGQSASDVFAVGEDGLVLRYDGARWAAAALDLRQAVGLGCPGLMAIAGSPGGEPFVAGEFGIVLQRSSPSAP